MKPAARLELLEAVARAIAERGYDGVDLATLAAQAGVETAALAEPFLRKDLAVLALYERFADAFAESMELPEGTVGARFRAAVEHKLSVLGPYRRVLAAIAHRALDPEHRLAIGGPDSERIRTKVAARFAGVVDGATDAPADAGARRRLAHVAYAVHLLVVLVWMLDEDAVREALSFTERALPFALLVGAVEGAVPLVGRLLPIPVADGALERARLIVERLLRRLRHPPQVDAERARMAVHAVWDERVARILAGGERLHLVLPGFPAKSPNPRKVLGARPDAAERLALESLETLARELAELHPAGLTLTLASDGHVFGSVVGITDAQCDAYRHGIREMVAALDSRHLEWFDLACAFGPGTADMHRQHLLDAYAEPIDVLRARGPSPLVDGIHRFLAEDERGVDPSISASQSRTRTRDRAYETVRRSAAWGALLAAAFPEAVRLSIHPQPVGAEKIGLHLLPVTDVWLTPWHGAALLDRDGFRLVKRADHPEARVVMREGRPDHLVAADV